MLARAATVLVLFSLAACGGGGEKSVDDARSDFFSHDESVTVDDVADSPGDEFGATDDSTPDPGSVSEDPGPQDPGTSDPGTSDPGTIDNGPSDEGAIDPGLPDEGPAGDQGPQYSETVAACIYVVENICAKMLTKCDLLGLIPPEWMETCTDFLLNNETVVAQACQALDDTTTSDPTIALIKSFGPSALKECTDNFQCTLANLGKLGDFILPLIQGKEVDTPEILSLVADLCFQ